jgi:predicted phosphodiesterase
LLGLSLVATPASCKSTDNRAGRVAANGSGDLGHPPAERIAPELAGKTACGAGNLTDAGARLIRRRPYLQRVTATSAVIVWTSLGLAPGEVALHKVSGAPVSVAPAALDQTARLPGGARQWTASLAKLDPNTTYCYEIREGGAQVVDQSPLTTAPAPGTGARVRMVVIGDSGDGGSDQKAVSKQLDTVPFDLMLHTGDVAYENGTLDDFESKFFTVYRSYLRRAPVFPASGNHDYQTANAEPYRQVFVLPENGAPEGRERWYSYDWGDIHLVALDTEKISPVQAAWLDADLGSNHLPWVIVYGHKPPYSSGQHGGDVLFQELFVPVLEKHHVPLVLAGHDHDYERFLPQNGTTYVVTGGGGRGVRAMGRSPMTAYAEPVLHLLLITVENDTLSLHAIDGAGREFDGAVIHRGS